MRAQIQAVHAQSPRTVQRNVDQITSDIKTNCDLRKSISFNGVAPDTTTSDLKPPELPTLDESGVKPMDYEYQEPMEQVVEEEPPFELPEGEFNPFEKKIISGLLRRMKFPLAQHAEGFTKLNGNLAKLLPSTSVFLGKYLLLDFSKFSCRRILIKLSGFSQVIINTTLTSALEKDRSVLFTKLMTCKFEKLLRWKRKSQLGYGSFTSQERSKLDLQIRIW